ncbi:MAG: hypothetical protein ABW039_11490 [Sphingobium sp.]
MSFAAILSATRATSDSGSSLRAGLHFAGQTLVEYQARQAASAGASHILIVVNVITPALSQAVDRLSADGIAVALVRDMVSLVRTAPRDMDAVLMADGAIVAQTYLDMVARSDGDALLVTDDSRASAPFERIDAGQRWGGLVRVSPALLFGTLDMIGDWDLALTLVRTAVQHGARRITISQDDLLEGRVSLVDGQAQADLAAQAVMAAAPGVRPISAGLEHHLLRPIAGWIAPALVRTQIHALHVRIASVALTLIALLPIELGWPVIGLLLLLPALLLGEVADRIDQIALRRPSIGAMAFATSAVALAGIALVGNSAVSVYLAILLAILTIATRRGGMGGTPTWQIVTPGTALSILLVASFIGRLSLGIDLAMVAALASLAAIILVKRDLPA